MRRAWLVLVPAAVAVAVAWLLLRPAPEAEPGVLEGAEQSTVVTPGGEVAAQPPGTRVGDVHRRLFEERMRWARDQRLDTLAMGELMVRLGRTFVGTTYTPGTLDPPGPERLVVNLTELDCVTYVEIVLAMARLLKNGQDDFEAFRRELTRIRYRGGELEGYASRLHYFSDWIRDNEAKGLVRDLTRELGGEPDLEPLTFMSEHRDAYRQLADPEVASAIREIESRLSRLERWRIPQERIASVASRIRNGDIIAATSALDGLDIAHTGLALWLDGELHLMHAPLVGRSVEISELPLAQRIQGIRLQDGIMVARPL